MYYQIVFNGLTTQTHSCLPEKTFIELQSYTRRADGKITIHPMSAKLFIMTIYDVPSVEGLHDIFKDIKAHLQYMGVDIIYSTLENGRPLARR